MSKHSDVSAVVGHSFHSSEGGRERKNGKPAKRRDEEEEENVTYHVFVISHSL